MLSLSKVLYWFFIRGTLDKVCFDKLKKLIEAETQVSTERERERQEKTQLDRKRQS